MPNADDLVSISMCHKSQVLVPFSRTKKNTILVASQHLKTHTDTQTHTHTHIDINRINPTPKLQSALFPQPYHLHRTQDKQ